MANDLNPLYSGAALMGRGPQPATGLDAPPTAEAAKGENDRPEESVEKQVAKWTRKLRSRRDSAEDDFKRMRENMDFTAGIQHKGQRKIRFHKYVSQLTNRQVNQKVSILYAKDPKAVYRRRKRLDFQIWDEKLESLGAAVQRATAVGLHGMPVDVEAMAIIQDYTNGRNFKELVDRVGRTLEVLYQYQIDEQEPNFKTQMKQLVRRTIICGVAFVQVSFERSYEGAELSQANSGGTFYERALRAKHMLSKLEDHKFDENSAEFEELRQLFTSLGISLMHPGVEAERVNERLVFDFIPSTAVLIDPACRCLKGFVGAHWIAKEHILPLEYVNACFETKIKPGGKLQHYNDKGSKTVTQTGEREEGSSSKVKVCLWEVFDKDTKTRFLIVDGYNDYVVRPEPLEPEVHGFWPIRALTFNDIEVDGATKATLYPPSDVDMLRHPQMAWNAARDKLTRQREANTPFYMTGRNWLSEDDLAALHDKNDNEVIQFENLVKGDDPEKVLVPFRPAPIDPAVYDVTPYRDDIMFAVGTQEANLGPAKANVTATVGSIAEQSRMTLASSNVDDLDDCLSEIAKIGGEMLMREMNVNNVKRIVGPGAVWPQANREDYLNAIYLETVAASSGRPNKAMEIANMQQLGPLLIQLGANPMFLVREMVKRLDDRMDPEEAFPLVPPSGVGPSAKPERPPQPQPAPQLMPGAGAAPPMQGQPQGTPNPS